jgi:hypothetical protein
VHSHKKARAGTPAQKSFGEEVLFIAIAAVLILAVDSARPASLGNDSFQYLSVAANIASGNGIETSIVHFDSERSAGRIPAPMTTFAPGYPIAVALGSFVTGNLERTAKTISMAASALSMLLIWGLAGFAGLDRAATRIGLALLLGNAFFLRFSDVVLTDPLFLLVSLAGLLALATCIDEPHGKSGYWWRLIAGQILVATSYSVRYAGIFVFVAVVVHSALSLALLRSRRAMFYFFSNAISGALLASIMIRNLLLVDSWKGGNDKQVNNSMSAVLGDYFRTHIHLLFGMHVLDVWVASVTAISAAVVLWSAAKLLRNRQHIAALLPSGGFLLVAYVSISTAGMIYLGKTSDISFGPRMFYPLLPLYIIGALTVVQRAWMPAFSVRAQTRYLKSFAVIFVVLYGWANLREFIARNEPSMADEFQNSYSKAMANGLPLREWIDANIGRNEVIAADWGQATGYFLERPVLSLIESEYSTISWDQETLVSQMQRFHARFLILNLTMKSKRDPVRVESQFLAEAICCRVNPGFHIVAENPEVRILEVNDQ